MMDSRQPPTTTSTCLTGGASRSKWQRWTDESLLGAMAKYPLGTLQMTGRIVRAGNRNERHLECLCSRCGELRLVYPYNVMGGKTTNCTCAVTYEDRRIPLLKDRWYAMYSRCNNLSSKLAKHYGLRGIECRFESCEVYVAWVLEHLPHPTYRGVDVDRRDNDGHYEPGNLRLVSRRVNNSNKRTTRLITYRGISLPVHHAWDLMKTDNPNFPFERDYTSKLLYRGAKADELLYGATRVGGRMSMTSSTPDPDIVSLYPARS